MRLLLFVCVFVASNTSVVHADETAATTPSSDDKSPVVAGLLSATPTVLGAGLGIAGLIVANIDRPCTGEPGNLVCIDYFGRGVALATAGGVLLAIGPSLGHIYTGRVWTPGLKVRIGGAGISALGLGLFLLPLECDGLVCSHHGIGALIMMGGAATVGVGAAMDAGDAPNAARKHNAQLSLARLRTPSGDSTPGLVFNTRF